MARTARQRKIEQDIEMFWRENVARFHERFDLQKLQPWEWIDYYLKWNGILGYTDDLIELFESAGWSLQRKEDTKVTGPARPRPDGTGIRT